MIFWVTILRPIFNGQAAPVLPPVVFKKRTICRMSEQVTLISEEDKPDAFQIIETQDNTDRDGILIAYMKAPPATPCVASPTMAKAPQLSHIEAIFKDLLGKSDHRLHTHRKVFLRLFSTDPRLLGNERVHSICSNHNV